VAYTASLRDARTWLGVGVPFPDTLRMENLGVRVGDCLPASVLTDLKSLAASKGIVVTFLTAAYLASRTLRRVASSYRLYLIDCRRNH